MFDAVRSRFFDEKSSNSRSEVEATISVDDAAHMLQNKRRRRVVEHVTDPTTREPYTTRGLSDHLAEIELRNGDDRSWSTVRKQTYVALYQSHLPKLEDHGVIVGVDTHEYVQGPNAAPLAHLADQIAEVCESQKPDKTEFVRPGQVSAIDNEAWGEG